MMNTQLLVMLIGDILVLGLMTVIGFASHDTLGSAGGRLLSTFIPLLLAWFMSAPFMGAYDLQEPYWAQRLWRPFWAMVLAGPMAGILRGFWLNAPVLPLFVVVIGGFSALALLAWRLIFWFSLSRWSQHKYG